MILSMILAVFSAILINLAFPNMMDPFGYGWLGWCGLIPLFKALDGQKAKQRCCIGMVFGLVLYTIGTQWIRTYSSFVFGVFVLILSLQPMLFSLFAIQRPESHRWWRAIFFPSLWVVTEWLRSYFLQGFTWNLSHSQSFQIYAVQMVDILGPYGLSFILVFINYSLYQLIKNFRETLFWGGMAVMSLGCVFGYGALILHQGWHNSYAPGIRTLSIQPNVDPRLKQDGSQIFEMFTQSVSLTQQGIQSEEVDLIVWPETAIPLDYTMLKEYRRWITYLTHRYQTYFLTGATLDKEGKIFNSAVFHDINGKVVTQYHKRFLVPFCEYLPAGALSQMLWRFFRFHHYAFVPGEEAGILAFPADESKLHLQNQRFGVAICSEEGLGGFFREFVRQGAGFVVVLLNNGWFCHQSGSIITGQMAILQAVANRIPVLRSTNSGWTSYIDPYGRVTYLGDKENPGFAVGGYQRFEIRPYHTITLYHRIADALCWVCLVIVIINYLWNEKIWKPKDEACQKL
jgi:apolipoprotein N-acyltransferase